MNETLRERMNKARAELRAAHEEALAEMARAGDRYRALWTAWKLSGGTAYDELYRTAVRESEAICAEIVAIADGVFNSNPDTDTFVRALNLSRIDRMYERVRDESNS